MRRLIVVAALTSVLAAPAQAQTCTSGSVSTRDACEKARDLFSYLIPQLGTSLVGGSATLGQGGGSGGFPDFIIALRANGLRGDIPKVDNLGISIAGAQRSTIATTQEYIGLPTVDVSLGLWKGINVGVTRIGAIDVLGGITYIPKLEGDGVSIDPTSGSTKIGLGARVGLLEESLIVPGVAFTFLKRDLPTVDFVADAGNDLLAINDFSVKTTSWRLSAQKNLAIFGLSAGFGQDRYDGSTSIAVEVNETGLPTQRDSFSASSKMTRTNYYGAASLNLFLFRLVGEVGRVTGGEIVTYNSFTEPAAKARTYFTLGARISF